MQEKQSKIKIRKAHRVTRQKMYFLLGGIVMLLGTGYLFYGNIPGMLGCLSLFPIYAKYVNKRLEEKRIIALRNQFKDALCAISSALSAGMSLENAISSSIKTLRGMYGERGEIVRAFIGIDNAVKCNDTIEHAFEVFADEYELSEIRDFAEVIKTAKRSRGRLVNVISAVSSHLELKCEVNRDIDTVLAGKKYEARIMNLMPLGIIAYIKLGLPDIADRLYGNVTGCILMSVALVIYIGSVLWSEKIVNETFDC